MSKTLKSWLFIGFMALMCVLFVWSYFIIRDIRIREAEIRREYAEEQEEYGNDRPLPDSIYMLPSGEITPEKTIKFGYDDEGRKLAEANALKINKRDNIYYWDSNGGKPLTVNTEIRPMLGGDFSRRASVFKAEDGSESVIIWHDIYVTKGQCRSSVSYLPLASFYVEYRLNENREFRGGSTFFPPRPDDWCKPLYERLQEEGIIGDIQDIFKPRKK